MVSSVLLVMFVYSMSSLVHFLIILKKTRFLGHTLRLGVLFTFMCPPYAASISGVCPFYRPVVKQSEHSRAEKETIW